MLTRAFDTLPVLESVHITDDFGYSASEPKLRILKKEPLLRAPMLMPHILLGSRGKYQLGLVTRALANSRLHLRHFALTRSASHPHGGALSPFKAYDHSAVENAYRSLDSLDLNLSGASHRFSPAMGGAKTLSFADILSVSRDLKDLSLVDLHRTCSGTSEPPLSFERLVGTPKFNDVQRLLIQSVIFEEHVMCNFLLQSCSGLRELRLEDARLLSGSWASLFKSLRQLSSLKVCELRDLMYQYKTSNGSQGWTTLVRDLDSMDLLSDYLCGRTHTDP